MSNCVDVTISTALRFCDNVFASFGFNGDYLKDTYSRLLGFFSPYVQTPLGLLGLDVDFVIWIICVLAPFILIVLLPLILFTLFYVSYFIINLVKFKHHLSEFGHARCWKKAARFVCAIMWRTLGRLWHGYEIHGLEKLPDNPESPALLVYYHGEIPLDCYYLMAELVLERHDKAKAVADRFLFHLPGWRTMLEVFNVIIGSRQECENALEKGSFLVLAPGGTREMMYSDHHYQVHWGSRVGYAKLAVKYKVPVYPVFTRNIREVFRFVRLWPLWSWQLKLYEKFKFPFALVYGGFPSKLITFIGDPVSLDPHNPLEVEELNLKVQQSMRDLIQRRQPMPGSILRAIYERFTFRNVSLDTSVDQSS